LEQSENLGKQLILEQGKGLREISQREKPLLSLFHQLFFLKKEKRGLAIKEIFNNQIK